MSLMRKYQLFLPSKVTKIKTADYIIFLKFNVTEVFRLQGIISQDLNTCTAFRAFSYLESQPKVVVTDQDIIEDIIVKFLSRVHVFKWSMYRHT